MNGQFQIAIHILTLLNAAGGEFLSSEYIAGSVNVNPVIIRKELITLRKHGLVTSREGKNGGYALGKPAHLITLAEIYQLVKQDALLGKARNTPNPECAVGRQINQHLDTLNAAVENAVLNKLGKQTLQDFTKLFQ